MSRWNVGTRGKRRDETTSPKPYSSYDGYYGKSQWKKTRERVLRRDNYTCQWCGYVGKSKISYKAKPKQHALVAHHIDDRKCGGNDDLTNLLTICMPCHNKIPGQH